MLQLRPEVLALTRACEHLLSKRLTLTNDERSLVEYYLNDLSDQFMFNSSSIRTVGKDAAQQTLPL